MFEPTLPPPRRLPPPPPPPIPPKGTRPNVDLARLLARRPPPPPNVRTLFVRPGAEKSGFCLECRDFSQVDAHAAHFPRHAVSALDELAHDLTVPFTNDTDKVRAIFTWLHHNIAYDTQSFFSGNVHAAIPESTVSSGLAVCDGYAGLFNCLAESIGIQAYKVTGHGKGVGYVATGPEVPPPDYSSNHAWNCAYMDGKWHLIDACWGAGALDGTRYHQRFTPIWFTSSPTEFGRCHFPEDPRYQLIPEHEGGPVSWESYTMQPATPIIFKDFHKLNLSPLLIHPSTRSVLGGQRTIFQVYKRCEHQSTAEADNFAFLISVSEKRVPLERDSEGGWSACVSIPRGEGDITLFYVSTISGRDAKGIPLERFKHDLGRQPMTFGGLARWTIA